MKPIQSNEMTDEQLNGFLNYEIQNCIGDTVQSDISANRKKALEYYLNLPRGDEEEGRSKLQDSSVNDAIEAFLPGLLAPFLSGEDVVEIKLRQKNDLEQEKQQSILINDVFKKDNDGDKILYQFAKDGLLQKNGFAYVDWSEKNCVTLRVQRVNYLGLQDILQNPQNKIIKIAVEINDRFVEQKDFESLPPEQLIDAQFEVKYRESKQEGKIKIANIPPENMLVHKDATYLEQPRLIGWREQKTISDLKAEGYEQDKLDLLANALNDNDSGDFNGERITRKLEQSGATEDSTNFANDNANSLVWVTVLFANIDYDGDGYAEYRKIIRAGTNLNAQNIILYNEEIDLCPIVWWTPIIMPHQMFGRSFADLTFSIQDAKTALTRAIMNAVYDIEPSYLISEQAASGTTLLDDMYNRQPRSLILTNDINGIRELSENAPDITNAYQFLEHFDAVRETRTPVTRMMQAVDPDLLKDKSATEATIQSNASMQRQELIIRLFALGVKELCLKIYQLLVKYQHEPRWIRMSTNAEPIQVNPQYWDSEIDINIKVGLGTGNKTEQFQRLMQLLQLHIQEEQSGSGIATPDKRLAIYSQIISLSNLGNVDLYFNEIKQNPESDGGQQAMLQQAQAQAFEEGRNAGAQEASQQLNAERQQMEAAKLQLEQQKHADKINLDLLKESNKMQLEQQKLMKENSHELHI